MTSRLALRLGGALAAFTTLSCDTRCAELPGAPPRRPRAAACVPETVIKEGKTLRLNIPDRKQAPGTPAGGWCGETAIQEALLYHGAFFPQKAVNKAGNPSHPDLYARDIPVALKNLGVDFEFWRGGVCPLGKFLAWVRVQIKSGIPVLAGIKIYPTQHKNWGLDHFILVVGYGDGSLVLNTTWGKQQTLTLKQLSSTQKGLSFKNRYNSNYGIRIKGPAGQQEGFVPVRLFAARETKQNIHVVVKCEGLSPRAEYAIYKLGSYVEKPTAPAVVFTAEGPTYAFHDTIDRKKPAVYRCRRAEPR